MSNRREAFNKFLVFALLSSLILLFIVLGGALIGSISIYTMESKQQEEVKPEPLELENDDIVTGIDVIDDVTGENYFDCEAKMIMKRKGSHVELYVQH